MKTNTETLKRGDRDAALLLTRIEDEILKHADMQTIDTYQLLIDLRAHIRHTEAVLDEIHRIGSKHSC